MTKEEIIAKQYTLKQPLAENKSQLHASTEVQQGTLSPKPWWRADEAMTISTVVLGFGILVLILAAVLLRRTVVTAESILRVFGTVIILIGAIFLVVAGYTEQQMGPVMGLLGTIAGYLLGKNNSNPILNTTNTEKSGE